jgi:Protein of unknown function (DUF3800)
MMMIDVNEIRNSIIALHSLQNVDEPYTFYYDETNNVKKLHLTPDSMNIRRPACFLVGGIVHRGQPRSIDLAPLRTLLQIQPSAKEIKLKHIGKGDFLDLLQSKKIELLLQWIVQQGFFIHYSAIDIFYWSIVDIVDSILAELGKLSLYEWHMQLKNSLYMVLRNDVDGAAEFFGRYNYPDVGREHRSSFIDELLALVESREHILEHFPSYMLKGLLQMAKELDRLPFLEEETPNVLINGFGPFFLNRLCLFKNAQHILDEENQIESYIKSLSLNDDGTPLSHFRFANSQSESGVQLSDIMVGLLGKLFTHVNYTSQDELGKQMADLTDQQRCNLSLLARLLDASTDECPGFAHYVLSLEDQMRTEFVLG